MSLTPENSSVTSAATPIRTPLPLIGRARRPCLEPTSMSQQPFGASPFSDDFMSALDAAQQQLGQPTSAAPYASAAEQAAMLQRQHLAQYTAASTSQCPPQQAMLPPPPTVLQCAQAGQAQYATTQQIPLLPGAAMMRPAMPQPAVVHVVPQPPAAPQPQPPVPQQAPPPAAATFGGGQGGFHQWLMNVLPQPIIVRTSNGGLLYANRAACAAVKSNPGDRLERWQFTPRAVATPGAGAGADVNIGEVSARASLRPNLLRCDHLLTPSLDCVHTG